MVGDIKSEVIKSLFEMKESGFFEKKKKRTISQIRDALHAKGRIIQLHELPSYLLKLIRNGKLKRDKKVVRGKRIWIYYSEEETPSPELFSAKLVKKLGKKFKTEIGDFRLVYGKSGTCTAFLLRRMLEKTIFLAFAKQGLSDKLRDSKGNFRGLEEMIDIAGNEKVRGVPFLLPKTARRIKGVKFLGDAAAHNFLVDIEMEEIIPQLPFVITAFKELSRKL